MEISHIKLAMESFCLAQSFIDKLASGQMCWTHTIFCIFQADSEEPPPKRVRTEAEDADDVKEASASELAEKSKEATEDTGDAALVNRVPISDLQTLQELGNIIGGCCICTLR